MINEQADDEHMAEYDAHMQRRIDAINAETDRGFKRMLIRDLTGCEEGQEDRVWADEVRREAFAEEPPCDSGL